MAEVVLSTDELTVLGGPSSISVDLDFGPQGQRGSQIFVGNGNPNLSGVVGQTPNVFDLFINLLNGDADYLYLYQYQNIDGVNSWVKLLKLIPNTYSQNKAVTFSTGSVQISIPVVDIAPSAITAGLLVTDFNIQFNVFGTNPIAAAVSTPTFTTIDGVKNLTFTIKATELSSGTWTLLSGSKTVQLLITVV